MKGNLFIFFILSLVFITQVFAEDGGKCQIELKDVHMELKDNVFFLDGKKIAEIDPNYGRMTGNVPEGVIKYYNQNADGKNYYLIFNFKYDESRKFDFSRGYYQDLIAIYDINGNIPVGLYCKDGKLNGSIAVYQQMETQLLLLNIQYENGKFKNVQTRHLGNEELPGNEVKQNILLKTYKDGIESDQTNYPGLGHVPLGADSKKY